MPDQPPCDFDARPAITTIERELRLVTDAIRLVASGRYPRVTVAGIRFGGQILAEVRREADASGVQVRQLFPSDDSGPDLIVERIGAPDDL